MRKRTTVAHTQVDEAKVTVEEMTELYDELLRIFADIWLEVYGQRLTLESLTLTYGGPVQEATRVGGLIHPIVIGRPTQG